LPLKDPDENFLRDVGGIGGIFEDSVNKVVDVRMINA